MPSRESKHRVLAGRRERVAQTRNDLLKAARNLAGAYGEADGENAVPDANADASIEYAEEQFALRARDHARAVNDLPKSELPVGWE